MNIADRTKAALMGHETRKKRQLAAEAIIEDLAVRHKGAAVIKIWWKTYVSLNPEAAKPWKGGTPMGYDGGPPTLIVKGHKGKHDLHVPAEYFDVEMMIHRTMFDSWSGRKTLSVYGRKVTETVDGEKHEHVIQIQRYLGSN